MSRQQNLAACPIALTGKTKQCMEGERCREIENLDKKLTFKQIHQMPALGGGGGAGFATKSPDAKVHTPHALDWNIWAKSQVQGVRKIPQVTATGKEDAKVYKVFADTFVISIKIIYVKELGKQQLATLHRTGRSCNVSCHLSLGHPLGSTLVTSYLLSQLFIKRWPISPRFTQPLP